MIKFILPALILIFVALFWEKINEAIYRKFNTRINYIVIIITILILGVILSLLYF